MSAAETIAVSVVDVMASACSVAMIDSTASPGSATTPAAASAPTSSVRTEDAVPSKRDEMLAKLQQLDADRQHSQDVKRQQRAVDAAFSSHTNTGVQREVDAFLAASSSAASTIGHLILSLTTLEPDALADIDGRLSSLRSSLNHSAHLLPSHDLRVSQTAIAHLEELLARQKDTLQPRKAFFFRSRRERQRAASATPAQSSPTAADAAPTAAASAPARVRAGFHHLTDRQLTLPPALMRRDLHLSHLTRCRVVLPSLSSSLHLSHLAHCTVVAGPVSGSVLMADCTDCVVVVACHQLRIHDSARLTFSLFCASHPIIEHSHSVVVDPSYALSYPSLPQDLADSGMAGRANGAAERVEDFNWLRLQQSPNWRFARPEERGQPIVIGEEDALRDDSAQGVGFEGSEQTSG